MLRFTRLEEVADGIIAKDFVKAVLDANKYSGYFEARERAQFKKSSDYDGHPFEDFLEVKKMSQQNEEVWAINFYFTPSRQESNEFDYSAVVRRSFTTAYKVRPPGPPVETKFTLERCDFRNNADKTAGWTAPVYRHLIDVCGRLGAVEEDLDVWAQAGLDMRVICPYCHAETLKNKRLCEFVAAGISVESLKHRLVCGRCGKREPRLRPT